MESLHLKMKFRKAIIFSKSHRLYINGSSTDVKNVLTQFKYSGLDLPALEGTQCQQLCQILLSDHRYTVEAARILSRLTFPYADSDGGFTSVHNLEEVKRNRVRMTQIHTERLQSQSYTVNDNPFLDGALAWDEEMNNFVFPPQPCTSCHEQGLGMVITNGMCKPCESKTRAFKFSHNNSMDPKLAPPCLQGLSPTEISAISLINPVMSIHRVNSTPHMKGSTISFPNDVASLANILPRTPAELDIVAIVAPGQPNRLLHVRRQRLLDALTWLKANNPFYANITISQEQLNVYPEAGYLEDIPTIELDTAPPQVNQGPEHIPDDAEEGDVPSVQHTMFLGNMIPRQRETTIILNALRDRANEQPEGQPRPNLGTDANPLPWSEQGEPIRDSTPGYFAMAFPHLFPYGLGDLTQERSKRVSAQEWITHLLQYKCPRFSQDHRFLFYAFHYMQKRRIFNAGNLYAEQDLGNMTRAELLQHINGSEEEAAELARRIIRKSAGILGSPASMRKFGQWGTNSINFYRHVTGDLENYNFFLTLSSADSHCNAFLRLYPDGCAHLAKTKVKNVEQIPQDADRGNYLTESEDFLFRRSFIVTHAQAYDIFFRHKVETFIKHIFIDKLGCLDHFIRYEFQARSAIHAHILMVIPAGISRADRLNAVRPWHQDVSLEQAAAFVDDPNAPLNEALKAVRTKRDLIHFATLDLGLVECHPSNSLGDRIPAHMGTMMQNPSNEVLRSSLTDRLSDPHRSLVNLVNKVGIHTCRQSYCLKPRKPFAQTLATIPEETESPPLQCRFDFPQSLLSYSYDGPNDAPTGLIRDNPPVLGVLNRVKDPASVYYNHIRLRLARNHTNVVIHNQDTTLSWQANNCAMTVNLEEDVKEYVCKYCCKQEEKSPAQIALEADILNHPGAPNTFCQRVLLKNDMGRDYALPEVSMHLNNAPAVKFSREMVHISVLEDTTLINMQAGEAETIGTKSPAEIYSNRFQDQNFTDFCRLYDQVDPRFKPCPKVPAELSLYDFMCMFTIKWEPLLRYKVVCPHPFFESLPNANSNPVWHRKCLLTTLRLHDPNTPSLQDLDLLTSEQLFDKLLQLIHTNSLPAWVSDMILNERVPPRSYIPTAEDDMVPDRVDHGDEDPLGGLLHRIDEDLEEEGGANLGGDDIFHPEDVQAGYDKKADFNAFTPTWTSTTPDQMRHSIHNVDQVDLSFVEPALTRDQLNPQQLEGHDFLLHEFGKVRTRPGHQFLAEICGGAGTGKTTLVKTLKASIASLLGPTDPAIGQILRFAAPTGCAAKLLPTPNSTLHSLLHLPITKVAELEDLTETTLKARQEELKHLKLLIIDEKSFVGARALSLVNRRMQQIFCNTEQLFGGVSVLLMGDFKQLNPVMDTCLYAAPRRNTTAIQRAGLECFKAFNKTIILTVLQRQADDEPFKHLLDQYVKGIVDAASYAVLEARFIDNLSTADQVRFSNSATLLCAVKADYSAFNRDKIMGCGTPRLLISSVNDPVSCASLDSSSAGGLPTNLVLCRDMRVMLTANLCLDQGLTNGSMGTVVAIIFISEEDPFPTVLVKFDEFRGESCLPDVPNVYPVGVITRSWLVRKKSQSRTMLPLQPGYALSIHKSQGQTLNDVLIDLGSSEFSPGLTYTALTRVRSRSNLALRKMPPFKRFQTIAASVQFKAMKQEEAAKLVMEQARQDQFQQELAHLALEDQSDMEVDSD